ncbi:MAG: hypothetical protein ACKVUS_01640 [Saprospiraceae bacterium]
MATTNNGYQYTFPEKDAFRGMEATEPEFDIFEPGRENLYVPLQPLRSPRQFERIKRELGIFDGQMGKLPKDYIKILFSGHRGCGKTVELLRFHKEIHQPEQVFCVFISLQDEMEINRLQPEDLYFILINKLLRDLRSEGVRYDEDEFEEIAGEWVKDKEITEEVKHQFGADTGAEAKAGFKFWNIFSVEGFVKSFYGYENSSTERIRHSIRRNPGQLVQRLNLALIGVRQAIQKAGKGRDLVFIVDDFEKTRPEVYNSVFIQDPKFIQEMNAHLICCVPIQTFYQVQNQAASDLFRTSYLPMIHLDKGAATFSKIITQRVDATLFEPGVLDQIVQLSGGSLRQLLRIANQCLLDTDERVTPQILAQTAKSLTVERVRPLTAMHRKLLEKRQFQDVSPELLELLFALNVMEYNGDDITRRINPLLENYFK